MKNLAAKENRPPSEAAARIIEAVCDVLSEEGIEALTLRAVARRAGATTGLIMHHFPNRAAMVKAALEATAAKEAAMVAWPRTADKAAVMAAIEVYLPLDPPRRRDLSIWVNFWALAITSPELRGLQKQAYDHFRQGHRAWIEQLGFSCQEALNRADRLTAVVDGIVIYALLDADYWTPERQLARARDAVDEIFDAAARRASGLDAIPSSAG